MTSLVPPLALLAAAAAFAPPPVAVVTDEGALPPAYRSPLCGLAVVRGLRPDSRLRVRSGPSARHPVVDRLAEGQTVYACNERQPWLGIVYAGAGTRCEAPPGQSLDLRQARSCRSGWVHRDWVEIITG